MVCVVLIVCPLPARQDTQVCGTHPDKSQEELALHRAWRRTLAAKPELRRRADTAARPAVRDIGNIAVLEDADGVVSRLNQFDLDRRQVRFVPSSGSARYRFEVTSEGYDAAAASAGEVLSGLGDDDARAVTLPFRFPFYGQTHTRLFVNSDGNLTFGAPDTSVSDRSIGRATSGPPRIAALFRDLDPSRPQASVRVLAEAGRFVVSWVSVPEYSASGFAPRQTFQARLFPDGRMELAYAGISTLGAVVGVAPGNVQGVSRVVSFLEGAAEEFSGAIVERFTSVEEIDIVFAAQKFYETHDDAYDYLVIYNNLNIDSQPGAIAYQVTVRNDRLGIGDIILDEGREYGSPRRLLSVLNLGPLSQYPRNPDGIVPGRSVSRDTPLTILGHETGHLWLAFASVREPGDPQARPMLGRDGAHWSFVFNSEASLLEGNRIEDNGPGAFPRFRTVATVEGYAPLDQYLMGLRAPEEVPSTFVVTEPTTGPSNRPPQSNVSFHGNRRDITIQELMEVEGRRVPDHTVSQRRFRFAFLLVTAAGSDPSAEDLAQLDEYRRRFEEFFRRVTNERAFADTTLKRGLQLSAAPAAGVLAGATATMTVSIQQAAPSAVTVGLRTDTGALSAPSTVTIPAGQTQAAFLVRGERVGVEELTAEPLDDRYAPAHARVQVSPSAASLFLAVFAGDKQSAVSGTRLPQPVVLRVVDRNNLPYPGIEVNAAVTPGGVLTSGSAISDADGFVRFEWTPGGGQLHELRAALAGNPSSTVLLTALGRPTLTAGGVVNAASFSPGLAPGALGTMFGLNLAGGALAAGRLPLSTELSGVRVLLNGVPAPLLYVSDRQINFATPADLAAGEAEVVVTIGGGSTAEATPPVRVPVRAVDPGIFFQPDTGLGAILVAGTGKTTAERAAIAGEILEIYCTGLGALRSNGAGSMETVARPQVAIGGRDAEVLFSGAAPGFPGGYQVNVRVPAGVASGHQPLSMRVDNAVSNTVQVVVGAP